MAGKAEIVDAVASATGLSKKDATAALEAFVHGITGPLKRGERVTVPGLGIFSVSKRNARNGVNPQTGDRIQIAPSIAARFRAGKDLKEQLNKKRR
jgi:DNA-binding protein HU-beta